MHLAQKQFGGIALALSLFGSGCERPQIQKVDSGAAVASLSPNRLVEIHGQPVNGRDVTVMAMRYNAQRETSVSTPVSMWTLRIGDVPIIAEKPVPGDADGVRGVIVDLQLEEGGKIERFVQVNGYLRNVPEWSPHR